MDCICPAMSSGAKNIGSAWLSIRQPQLATSFAFRAKRPLSLIGHFRTWRARLESVLRAKADIAAGASAASDDHQPAGGHMRRFAALVTLAFVLAACSPDGEATGSISSCATELYPAYNPKVLDQCVAVCKKCDRGITTTCTTSCTLKGAR